MITTSTRLVSLASIAALAGTAHAQLIAYDGFNYPAASALNVSGNGGFGWAAPWSPSYGVSWITDSVGSSYINAGLSLQRAGRRITGSNSASQRSISLGTPLGNTPGTVWVSFIAQQTSGTTNSNWLGVKLPCTPGAGVDQFIFIGKPYTRTAWGLDPGGFSRHRTGAASVFAKSFIVAKIDLRPGLDDVRVWVNPPLFGTPSNATASVTALSVGNFEGISKAIAEVGSTSGVAAGNIDELRIGRSYADVAPYTDGIMFQGRLATAQGNAQIALSGGALAISNLGGVGDDGVRVAMGSRNTELAFNVGPFTSGQQLNTTSFNALGQRLAAGSIRRNPNGTLFTSADFSGIPGADIQSVNVVTKDGDGNVISALIAPGSSGTSTTPNAGPCPPGYHLTYGRRDQFVINPDGTITITTIYGFWCVPSPVFDATLARPDYTIEFSATFNNINVALDTSHVDTTATNIDDFTILRASGGFHDLSATGIGDVALSEQCSGPCSDPNTRELTIDGNGGVMFDLSQSQPVTSVEAYLRHTGDTTTPAVGWHEFRAQGRDPIAGSVNASLLLRSDGLGGGTAQLLCDGVTSCRYTVTDQGFAVASWEGPPQALAMQIPKYVNKWVKFWCEVGSTWPGLSAEFENYFALAIPGGGGGSVSGNGLVIEVLNNSNQVTLTNFQVLGQDNAGPMTVTDIDTNTHNPCPADFNNDGFTDGFDYDDFVAAFEGQGPGNADFNQDGFTDGFDYDAFVQAFEQGC